MTRRFCIVALTIAALGAGACAAVPKPDLEAEKAAIKAVAENFAAAVNQKNVEAAAALYSDDAVLVPAGAESVHGREAIKSFLGELIALPGFGNFRVTPEQTDIAASGDLAVDRGTFSMTLGGPTGPVTNTGRYVVALRKVDGAWKIFLDADNSPTPPPAPSTQPK